jgi:hypothetical protein
MFLPWHTLMSFNMLVTHLAWLNLRDLNHLWTPGSSLRSTETHR